MMSEPSAIGPPPVPNSRFLEALAFSARRGTCLWVNAYIGNPDKEGRWAGQVYKPSITEVDGWQHQNAYFSVAALRQSEHGDVRRAKACFDQLLALVADDVRLVDFEQPEAASWIFETSPGNCQIGYFLRGDDEDARDQRLVDAVIRALGKGVVGNDESGNNCVRYMRLPVGRNLKERQGGAWDVRALHFVADRRFSLHQACQLVGLDLEEIRERLAAQPAPDGGGDGQQQAKMASWIDDIISDNTLHQPMVEMAASLVASGLHPATTTSLLQGLLKASSAPRNERFTARWNEITAAVRSAEEKYSPGARLRERADAPSADTPTITDPGTGEIRRALFVEAGDLVANLRPTQWLVRGYLETDALSMVFGPSGVGKSFVMVDLACCIATGTPWHHQAVTAGAVYYIAGEGHNGIAKRMAAWQKESGVSLAGAPIYKSVHAVSMMDDEAVSGVVAEIDARVAAGGKKPVAVIIDTLARNMGDGDENDAKDANKFVESLDILRRTYGCNVVVVHHSGHVEGRARGSSAFKAAMDQEIEVAAAGRGVTIRVTKMKDAETPPERRFMLKSVELMTTNDGEVIDSAVLAPHGDPLDVQLAIDAEKNPITARDLVDVVRTDLMPFEVIKERMGLSEKQARRLLSKAQEIGLIVKSKENGGWGYRVAEKAENNPASSISRILQAQRAEL